MNKVKMNQDKVTTNYCVLLMYLANKNVIITPINSKATTEQMR